MKMILLGKTTVFSKEIKCNQKFLFFSCLKNVFLPGLTAVNTESRQQDATRSV